MCCCGACWAESARCAQALAKDKLYPYIYFFAKGYGANQDPFRGYVIVFIVAEACVVIGEWRSHFFLLFQTYCESSCQVMVKLNLNFIWIFLQPARTLQRAFRVIFCGIFFSSGVRHTIALVSFPRDLTDDLGQSVSS